MYFAIAIGNVNVPRAAFEGGEAFGRAVAQHHVTDVDICFHGGAIHVGQETIHLADGVDE